MVLPVPSRSRRLLFPAAVAAACFGATDSRADFSPLSIHEAGFGIEQSPNSSREKAMGEAGMASITKQGLSIANPSKTAFHEKTSFTATADADVDYLQDDATSNRMATFLIPNIGLNFSLRKFGHLAFYYRHRFHRNYSFTPLDPVRADAVQSFSAEGGLYEAAVTYALAPIPSLAVGVGLHYFMSRERWIEKSVFSGDPGSEDLFNGEDMDGDTVSSRSQGGLPSLSITYRRPTFSLALAGTLGATLEEELRRSITNLVSDQRRDGDKELPWTVSGGGAYKLAANQTLVADFYWEAWDEAENALLNPSFRAGLGYEFTGRGGPYEPYYRKLAYRGGLGYERMYLEESDLYFLTTGAGLPLGRRGSWFDLAIKYGHRSAAKNNLWSEDYVKLSVSLTGVGNWGQPVRKRR